MINRHWFELLMKFPFMIGGGYESTHFWADPNREFVGVIMSQMSFARPEGYQRDNAFKGELYNQLFELESITE